MESHTLAIMSANDRRELPPVLRYSRYLYIAGTSDQGHVSVSDRTDGRGTRFVIRDDHCVSAGLLCQHCPKDRSRWADCRKCMLSEPGVPPTHQTVADYACRLGIRIDGDADKAVLEDFFGGPDYLGIDCGEPARCMLLTMKAAQDVARELPGGEYTHIRSEFARRTDEVLKGLDTRWVVESHEGLWTYLDIFLGRYVQGLCSRREFKKGDCL